MSDVDWSAKFNELPFPVRRIGAAMELETRIQHLMFERNRLEKRYHRSCAEIKEHKTNCEKALLRLGQELTKDGSPQ